MAVILTNGSYYIKYSDTGATKKTKDINEAYCFPSVSDAIKGMKKAEKKTKDYYVLDTLTQHILWKWMTQDEIEEMRKSKVSMSAVKRDKNGKIIRKKYSDDTRKLIYLNAHGRCELCGRKILLEDMTIDHIEPLSMGGIDSVENLACTCYPCNIFKGNVLPADFMEKIIEIFMYQVEKRIGNGIKWKVINTLIGNKLIKEN